MSDTRGAPSDGKSSPEFRPSEAETLQLLQEATTLYEEYMRLADLASIPDVSEVKPQKYAWDNPIGLVVTRDADAELV